MANGHAPPHKFQRRSNQWFWRRSLVFIITAFCMTALTWLMWNGVQNGELHKIIAQGCMWLLAVIYITYVVGATTDDLVSLAKGVRGIQDHKESE